MPTSKSETEPATGMLMPNCSWDFVVSTLQDNELKRLACCYLHQTSESNVNWNVASQAFGSASTNSFRTTIRNTLNKLNTAVAAAGDAALVVTTIPTDKPKGGRPKRNLEKPAEPDDIEAPSKKVRREKKSVVKSEDEDLGDLPSPPCTPKTSPKGPAKTTEKKVKQGGKAKKQASNTDEVKEEADVAADFYGVGSTS